MSFFEAFMCPVTVFDGHQGVTPVVPPVPTVPTETPPLAYPRRPPRKPKAFLDDETLRLIQNYLSLKINS